jgi:hypothetical protein
MPHSLHTDWSQSREENNMLARYLEKQGGRVTARGYKVSEWLDALGVFLLILAVFGIVGSIESEKWF